MQTEEKLKKRIAYEKMLAGISEQAVSVYNLNDFLSGSPGFHLFDASIPGGWVQGLRPHLGLQKRYFISFYGKSTDSEVKN